MSIALSSISLIPLLVLVICILSTERLSNSEILSIALLSQLALHVQTMFSGEVSRSPYFADLHGGRLFWATLSVCGTLGVLVCAALEIIQIVTMFPLTAMFVGQYMLLYTYWKRARTAY